MIVNMKRSATSEEIDHVIERIKECGFQAHVVRGEERTIIGAIGSSGRRSEIEALRAAPGVAEVTARARRLVGQAALLQIVRADLLQTLRRQRGLADAELAGVACYGPSF